MTSFTLSSPEFADGQTLGANYEFQGFGCAGDNLSPELHWSEPPAGTQSFAVTVYDPDAPSGSGWWHWMVYNLPADCRSLPRGAGSADGQGLPAGAVQNRIDYGIHAYGGMCPPAGDPAHRYIFTVYALSVPTLDVPADATAALTGFMIHGHSLGQASITTYYGR